MRQSICLQMIEAQLLALDAAKRAVCKSLLRDAVFNYSKREPLAQLLKNGD
jgi:hypothetical protein